jgi:hypothetical protein
LAAVGPEPAAVPAEEVPPPTALPAPAPVAPVIEVALPAPLPLTLPLAEVPGAGESALFCGTFAPFCGTFETAPCCCAVGSGPPLTAATMASCVRRLPPQALTAIAGNITIIHHHRELERRRCLS